MVTVRRVALLFLGILGSMIVVVILQHSVQSALVKDVYVPVQAAPKPAGITLPVAVPETDILVERVSSYEGPFLEDGSGKEVVNIAALHIYNTGERELLNACITLHYGEQSYVFYGEHIPPGATVVLLEMKASTYRQVSFTDCTGWQEAGERPQQNGILITEDELLAVTNTTQQTLQNVSVYYKSWLSPPDVYMGGITYHITIPFLLPGQTQTTLPPYYAEGYSKVVSVTAEP